MHDTSAGENAQRIVAPERQGRDAAERTSQISVQSILRRSNSSRPGDARELTTPDDTLLTPGDT